MILDSITCPADLASLKKKELDKLAAEIRRFLVVNVAKTGGHLGPNLGVVELTIALHRVFDSPRDVLVWDTGHQAYVHKILTGRKDFDRLRHEGGLSGYPSRAESEHDVVENSHASTALSWADGISRGMQMSGKDHHVVAIIGDGAMTGGMAWEALNNIAEDPERPVVIVLNDNGRSYAPTVGGIVRRFDPVRKLDAVRVNRDYENFLDWGKRTLQDGGLPGKLTYDTLRGIKKGMKEIFFDAGIFDSLGLKYIGPVDGHDIVSLEEALRMARDFGGPVVVHAMTEKGRGYKPAEENKADRFHAVGKIHPETGLPMEPSRFGWTSIFAEEILQIARKDAAIVGVTAAMLQPVGLSLMKEEFPRRVIDVGIAEQHAVTMAAGLAKAGFHPVVALYATFLNRGFDQLLMDVALHGAPVTICLDRAGVTGDDGASHNGMWDLSMAAMIPNLAVATPRDEPRMRELLHEATATEAPTIVRYPKGSVPPELPITRKQGSLDVLFEREANGKPLVFVGIGPLAHTMVEAAEQMDESLIVVDPRWVLPTNPDLVELVASSAGAVVLEDGLIDGGVGDELRSALARAGSDVPVRNLGVHKAFLTHASRSTILHREGMDAAAVIAAAASLR
ncbi:1-deoxy-D-xylulose-5-phosphate synthase [Trueperella bernardiae]|uniref:1-deoxy-D-xylulose-5-phosphate synthase n=1 Tax=Trueperella bernardiae TaxID=59561 RepID=A0A0W1KMR4_9ACTO|nr:1-deoxy-D-xylulose-5-phosphate synthase [Trueperella bernardiae]KTF04927.1 1-deoxy-D-xylulose-5-phosphate synthase [Trueperella bernardiae]MDK8601032.1 1-deoxy-D-xylulose-5-phosphate synthase [Trueperella bernardiae]MDV6238312.1 1-deoxy-D-xylulose-5-phosphate synthase [Trueperella bernardiae]OCW60992.1 1-deoxy-D-xylulose-5-phosphate synthase [Trueperella bernardiae]